MDHATANLLLSWFIAGSAVLNLIAFFAQRRQLRRERQALRSAQQEYLQSWVQAGREIARLNVEACQLRAELATAKTRVEAADAEPGRAEFTVQLRDIPSVTASPSPAQ